MDGLRPLARGFSALALATWGLIVLGALVRANGAGLACPDWPLCFGKVVPVFDVRIAFEWGHRLVAGLVSLGLGVLTVAAWRRGALARIRGPLVVGWTLLAVQVVLGGLTVLLKLAPWTVTAHLIVGNGFCLTLLWAARDLGDAAHDAARSQSRTSTSLGVWVGVTAVLLALQMGLGGMVSSHSAGLACADFPSCDGQSFVPTLTGLVGLHVVHRLIAFALLASFATLAFVSRGSGRAGWLAVAGLRLVLVQILLGIANVLFRLPVEVTALHSAVAAALVLLTGLLVREVVYARAPDPTESGDAGGREPLEVS